MTFISRRRREALEIKVPNNSRWAHFNVKLHFPHLILNLFFQCDFLAPTGKNLPVLPLPLPENYRFEWFAFRYWFMNGSTRSDRHLVVLSAHDRLQIKTCLTNM